MSIVMVGVVAESAGSCALKCPPHAIAAVVGAIVIGFLIGFFVGRRSKCSANQGQQKQRREARREVRSSEPRMPIPAGSVEIYVGNLSYDLTEARLRKEFEAFGTVATSRIVTNKFNDKSKGYGFVVMPNRTEAEAAIAAMSEKDVLGRKMRVNEARNTIKEEA